MNVTPQEFLALFKDVTKIIQPQINHYAITELTLGARIRVAMKDGTQYYLATADSFRRFFGENYVGAIMALRNRYDDDNSIQIYKLYIHADAVAFCDKIGGDMISPVDAYWSDLFYADSNEEELRQHFLNTYKFNDPSSFEEKWKSFISMMREPTIIDGQVR